MKRTILCVVALVVLSALCLAQNVKVTRAYSYPVGPVTPQDSLFRGLSSIRCVALGEDVDKDGKKEIAMTNYDGGGRVHVFEVVGTDSLALVWTSPSLGRTTAYATPRTVLFGDLDTDGKMEIICDACGQGIYIFEWDGVTGSDNYGTMPSYQIATPLLTGNGYVEYMEVLDVDGDAANELLVAYRAQSATAQKYCVFSANGDWSTNDPGFTSVAAEFDMTRISLATYGVNGGSPVALIAANLDGTGNKEILLHNWSKKNVTPIRVTGPNTYVLADTTNLKQNCYLGGASDDVALFGGLATDIDGDGREEVYLPTWYGTNTLTANPSILHMVSYPVGSSTAEIDSATNVTRIDLSSAIGLPDPTLTYSADMLGIGYGDIDGNGKKNIYVSGIDFITAGFNIASVEFQGGDKRNPANWVSSVLYKNEPAILASMMIKDSAGSLDTTKTIWAAQVAKMYARETDLDGDGLEDILMPYQGWYNQYCDSVSVTKVTWSGSVYDTTKYKFANSRRWTFRVLERSTATGVEAKDLTVITPEDYALEQNYPNPFNPTTSIRFSLPVDKKISLIVYDMLGKEVKALIAGQDYEKGSHTVTWYGTNNAGRSVASGSYIYTLKYGNFEKSQKMLLVR
jgi:hypothetical protein